MSWQRVTPAPHRCYSGPWPPGAETMGVGSIWACDVCPQRWEVYGIIFGSLRLWRDPDKQPEEKAQ